MKLLTVIMPLLAFLLLVSLGCEKERTQVGSTDADDLLFAQAVKPPKPGKPTKPTKTGKSSTSKTDTATPAPTPATPAGKLSRQETYTSYGVRNGGRQAWRIPKKGPEFGAKVKVVFSNGHTVMVNDTSHNYRESDGFVFKPGIGPNGEGTTDTGTAHGGVYLHAPYGNKSTRATFYY